MGHWNYRVMRKHYVHDSSVVEQLDEIHEVYYDDDGNITGWTDDAVSPLHTVGDEGSILDVIKMMERATTMPTLAFASGRELDNGSV